MPEDFAKRLAERLVQERASEYPIVVDVPNDGFNDKVADHLRAMGFAVVKTRDCRLEISLPPS